MTNGPSGKGVDDLYTPEMAASGASRDIKKAEVFDDKKIEAVLNEINGKDHSGTKPAPTPARAIYKIKSEGSMRILLVEDERKVASFIAQNSIRRKVVFTICFISRF